MRRLALVSLCASTVVAGTLATITLKAAYQTKVHSVSFSKPFFMEQLVVLAMTTSLLMLPIMKQSPMQQRPPTTRCSVFRHYLPLLPLATSDLLVGIGDTT